MERYASGFLHEHTDASLNDGFKTVEEYVQQAKEMGAKFAAITDHGTLMNDITFYQECKKVGIKPILGVEIYFGEFKSHQVLLARNYEGWKKITLLVKKSNENMIGKTGWEKPVCTKEMFDEVFSYPESDIIVLSGCCKGYFASILLKNDALDMEAEKILQKISKLEVPEEYQETCQELENMMESLEKMELRKERVDLNAKRSYRALENKGKKLLKSSSRSAEGKILLDKAEKIKEARENALSVLPSLRDEIKSQKREISEKKKKVASLEKLVEKERSYRSELKQIREQKVPLDALKKECEIALSTWNTMFEYFFVELQYHGVEQERKVMPILSDLAKTLGIPVVATNDSHVAKKTDEEFLGRNIIKSLQWKKFMPLENTDRELYMKSDSELWDALSEILPLEVVTEAILTIETVGNLCDLEFPIEQHYPKYPKGNAKAALRNACEQGRQKLIEQGIWNETYEKRLEYEFSVISEMGFCDYLMIVLDVIQYAQKKGKDNPENVGVGVGFGRGSAVGSLVCYLSGITSQTDPVAHGLLFERFLNKDRVTMPDIDVDIAKYLREDVIRYVKNLYGEDCVCNISTKDTLAGKLAIRSVARVIAWKKEEEEGVDAESIRKKYLKISDRLCKAIQDEEDWYNDLMSTVLTKEEIEILDLSKAVSGRFYGIGCHAAGIVISDGMPLINYLPLMWDNVNNIWKTQCNMGQVEELGCLKMDFLGLQTLDILTDTMRQIKRNYDVALSIEQMQPDEEVFNLFKKGATAGIFQFSSPGMKKTLKNFKPCSIEDLTLLNAVYRPGPMQYIDSILEVKNGKREPNYILPEMEDILKTTYGYPVYQEQIMQLFQLAGFSLSKSDIIRRYMSKKKTEKFMAYKDEFVHGFLGKGANKEETEKLWEQLLDFSKYAFNKSHSAVYACLAYKTAWLKVFYPAEFYAGYLNIKPDEIADLDSEKQISGVRFLPPDVNEAGLDFKALPSHVGKRKKVRLGLKALRGVNDASCSELLEEREKNGEYKSIVDLLSRVTPNRTLMAALVKSGSLDSLCPSRCGLLEVIDVLLDTSKKFRTTENADLWENIIIPDYLKDDIWNTLSNERYVTGIYLKDDILNYFTGPGCLVSKATAKDKVIFGIVDDTREILDRNGEKMAFAKVTSGGKTMEVVCFASSYAKISLQPGVYSLYGKMDDSGKFILSNIVQASYKEHRILFSVPDSWDAEELDRQIAPFCCSDGKELVIKHHGFLKKTKCRVSSDILEVFSAATELS